MTIRIYLRTAFAAAALTVVILSLAAPRNAFARGDFYCRAEEGCEIGSCHRVMCYECSPEICQNCDECTIQDPCSTLPCLIVN
jgi:hypothetical protein